MYINSDVRGANQASWEHVGASFIGALLIYRIKREVHLSAFIFIGDAMN